MLHTKLDCTIKTSQQVIDSKVNLQSSGGDKVNITGNIMFSIDGESRIINDENDC